MIYLSVKYKDLLLSSVIGTKWGIWVISNDYDAINIYDDLNDDDKMHIKKIVQDQLSTIDAATLIIVGDLGL